MRLVVGILALFLPAYALADAPCSKHIVFDIDGTLAYKVTSSQQLKDPSQFQKLLGYKGVYYKFSDEAPAVLDILSAIPGLCVSFFSGGEKDRNEFLLEHILLRNGRTAKSVAFRILSKSDLTPRPPDANVNSHSNTIRLNMKDLTKISSDLDELGIVDDIPDFIKPGQEANVVSIAPAYDYLEDFSLREKNPFLRFPPESATAWQFERKKLVRALGIIEEANRVSSSGHTKFRDALYSLQHDENGNWLDPFSQSQSRYFELGAQSLRKFSGAANDSPCAFFFRAVESR